MPQLGLIASPQSRESAPVLRPGSLVVAAWVALGIATSIRTAHRPDSHTVFPVMSAASPHWWNAAPLYADYKTIDYFRYPPSFAILVTPLVMLGSAAGGILWTWLSLAVYAAGLWSFRRHVLPGTWTVGQNTAF